MKKKVIIGILSCVILIGIVAGVVLINKNDDSKVDVNNTVIIDDVKEYKYICFTVDVSGVDIMDKDFWLENTKECVTNKKLDSMAIVSKDDLSFDEDNDSYIITFDDDYQIGDPLYLSNFLGLGIKEKDIQLLDELEVVNMGNSMEDLIIYNLFIENNKLYAINTKTNETKVLFDKESVKKIAVRNICCGGSANLIILTDNGNVYYSNKDVNYEFSFDFTFRKLNVSNITGFKLVRDDSSILDNEYADLLYAVDKNNNKILINEK